MERLPNVTIAELGKVQQTEKAPDKVHTCPVEWAGAMLLQDALPGYLYAGGDRNADRIDRIQSAGEWGFQGWVEELYD